MAHNSSVETIKLSSHSLTFSVLKGGKMSWTQLLEEADFQANFLEELQEEENQSLSEYENSEKEEFLLTPEDIVTKPQTSER